jgi:hypothetical protein
VLQLLPPTLQQRIYYSDTEFNIPLSGNAVDGKSLILAVSHRTGRWVSFLLPDFANPCFLLFFRMIYGM